MKKTFASVVAGILSTQALSAYAAEGGGDVKSPIKSVDDIYKLMVSATTWLYRIFFVLAVFYILLAAYRYLSAQDDAAKVKKATASLKNAAIAIAIALISTGASLIIQSALKL